MTDRNGKAAIIRMGLEPRTAHIRAAKFLDDPDVQELIRKAEDLAAIEASVSQAWVINKLKNIAARCEQVQPVLDRQGNPTGMFVFDASGAIRAYELIGKHIGMFKDRMDLNLQVEKIDRIERRVIDVTPATASLSSGAMPNGHG